MKTLDELLIEEMAKLGTLICLADFHRCLNRAGAALIDKKKYENWSWTVSPDRMGS